MVLQDQQVNNPSHCQGQAIDRHSNSLAGSHLLPMVAQLPRQLQQPILQAGSLGWAHNEPGSWSASREDCAEGGAAARQLVAAQRPAPKAGSARLQEHARHEQEACSSREATLYSAGLVKIIDSASSLSFTEPSRRRCLSKGAEDVDTADKDMHEAEACHGMRRVRRASKGLDRVNGAGMPVLRRLTCTMYRLPAATDVDHCCSAALGIANDIMQGTTLPGLPPGSFLTVTESSLVYRMGVNWGFTAMSIALGSSYFQRLCHYVPSVQWAAQRHYNFLAYTPPRPFSSLTVEEELGPNYASSTDFKAREVTLRSILLTCVFIGSKNIDRVGHQALLRHMLARLYGVPVTYDHCCEVEEKCLHGLGWRLGPYFWHDQLDEEWQTWVLDT